MTRLILASTASLLLGASLAQAAEPAPAPAPATPPAAPQTVDCLDLIQIDRTQVLDDQTILFHMKNRKIWKNTLPYKCPQLGFEKAFKYKTSIGRICNVDMITVLHTGGGIMEGATCGLGKFEAYTPPPKGGKGDKTKDKAGDDPAAGAHKDHH